MNEIVNELANRTIIEIKGQQPKLLHQLPISKICHQAIGSEHEAS